MSGLRSLIPGAMLLSGGTAVQAFVSIATTIFLAQKLSPIDFGKFAILIAGIGLAASIISLRLSSLILRVPEQNFDSRRQELYFSALAIETVAIVVLGLVWLLVNHALGGWEISLVVSQALLSWATVNRTFFERRLPYARLAVVETASSISAQLVAVVAVLSGAGAASLYLREITAAGMLLVSLRLAGGLTWLGFRWPMWGEWAQLLKEARGVWIDGVLEGGFQRISVLTSTVFLDARNVGYLFMAQSLAMRPNQLLAPIFSRVAAGWFARLPDRRARQRDRGKLLVLAAVPLVVLAVVAFLVADPVVPWVLGGHWAEAAPIVAALAPIIVFQPMFETLRSYSVVSGWTRLVLLGRIAQFVGFGGALAAFLVQGLVSAVSLGATMSIAYVLAFAALWVALKLRERRWP